MEAMTHGAVSFGLSDAEIAEKHPEYAAALAADARERRVSYEALLRFVRKLAHDEAMQADVVTRCIARDALALFGSVE